MEVRRVRREELRAAHETRLATWRVAYRGIVPDDHLAALVLDDESLSRFEQRFDEGIGRTFAAFDDDAVVGMSVAGRCRDEDREGQEELYAIYVLPSHWGAGVGQALWEASAPFTSLWVLEANARARAFYARNGFRPDITKEITFGAPLTEVRYVLA
ncbi:MAG: GNAT family N-acetyltransferase [Actinomycetota bacterium]|nr:GNAT family N-acetyltransferase [Actinomycetota bacterium]